MYIDATREDIFIADPTFAVSLNGNIPAYCKGDIYIAPVSLSALLSNTPKTSFYIPPVTMDAGVCFSIRNAGGKFSFTDNFESIIKNLTLTVCNVVKNYRREVRQVILHTVERAKNVVRSTAPRFLRL